MPYLKPAQVLVLQYAATGDRQLVEDTEGLSMEMLMDAINTNPVTGNVDPEGQVVYVNGVWVDVEDVMAATPVKRVQEKGE